MSTLPVANDPVFGNDCNLSDHDSFCYTHKSWECMKGDRTPKSVLQDWVMRLPLRGQGGLIVGLRGCDLAPKNPGDDTPERALVAFLRFCVMNPADAREIDVPGAFFRSTPPDVWKPSQFGHYPQHWYAHIMHAFEIVGYFHPDNSVRTHAFHIYSRLVHNLHLNVVETKAELLQRLTEDRIANATVVS